MDACEHDETVIIRPWREMDVPDVAEVHRLAYSEFPDSWAWTVRQFQMQFAAFPEGQFVAEVDGRVVGYATSIIVLLDDDEHAYKEAEITGAGTFSTHEMSGDTLYGADIAVHPDYRRLGISSRLYEARKTLLERYNLRRMIAYGRIPGYSKVAGRMTAQEYVAKVVSGDLKDPSLGAHLKAGYQVKRVLLGYTRDKTSLNYCTVLEYKNPSWDDERRRLASPPLRRPVRRMRVCAAQYLQRRIKGWSDVVENVEFFATAAEEYHCHVLLLPEYFSAQMLGTFEREWDERRRIEALAAMHGDYLALFERLAKEHGLYIIGGTHPVEREGLMYNVAHLFTPRGNVFTQDKLHITPHEREDWGIVPGEKMRVFDTPLGRIAIQICYDIEFPELARLQTLAGVEVIFVPFSTDEKKAYYRVRYSAQARAVENYVYTVIAGNVGNLPGIRTYLLNYGQNAIFTPSDFAFPLEAILGEADPNVEAVVIADLDFLTLAQQREMGSVRPLYERRADLYEVKTKIPFEIIETD